MMDKPVERTDGRETLGDDAQTFKGIGAWRVLSPRASLTCNDDSDELAILADPAPISSLPAPCGWWGAAQEGFT